MTDFDIVIIGAGIAGAGLAAQLAEAGPLRRVPNQRRILLLEAEAHPGYHATGRSVAFWTESYGGPDIQPLTTASRLFLASPPPEFSDVPFMVQRGALHIGKAEHQPLAAQLLTDFAASGITIGPISPAQIAERLPFARSGWDVGLYEPECCDIDVAALHGAYLRQATKCGAQIRCNAPVRSAHYGGGKWTIDCSGGPFTAQTIVNAAGAWADGVAALAGVAPIGITPYRRTVVQLQTSALIPPDLPLVIALDGSLYFKPSAGGTLWLSPHDETPTPPCDAAAEELDIALAIDRFQQMADCGAITVAHKWAGLRSFAPDRLPVIGRDPACPAFFWLAGQGGFGIQTAPAVSRIAASLLCDDIPAIPDISAQIYAPERLR